MNMKNFVCAAALLLALLETAPTEAAARQEEQTGQPAILAEASENREYQSGEMRLTVPASYDRLLLIKTNGKNGELFSAAEKASYEAAKALGQPADGAGWLFSIGKVGEAQLREMLCSDMSGAEVFARDAEGNHYIFYHPTDVRYMRESAESMRRGSGIWAALNEWAWQDARRNFLADNPGLIRESYDNSSISIRLARILYKHDTNYTVIAAEYGSLPPDGIDASPYASRLFYGANYEMAVNSETPDGEYIVLRFPNENARLDFFLMQGKENYVREVWDDSYSTLYLARFDDDTIRASDIMREWYNALAAAHEK